MDISKDELRRRYSYIPSPDEKTAERFEEVRDECYRLATRLRGLVPECPEAIIALERLDEVMFWANAGIARHPADPARVTQWPFPWGASQFAFARKAGSVSVPTNMESVGPE